MVTIEGAVGQQSVAIDVHLLHPSQPFQLVTIPTHPSLSYSFFATTVPSTRPTHHSYSLIHTGFQTSVSVHLTLTHARRLFVLCATSTSNRTRCCCVAPHTTHTHTHTHTHTYTHTYMHTLTHAYIHVYKQTSIEI